MNFKLTTDKYIIQFNKDGSVEVYTLCQGTEGDFVGAFDDFDTMLETGLEV